MFFPWCFLNRILEVRGLLIKRLVRPGGDTPPKKKVRTKEDGACVKCSKQLLEDENALECVWCDGVEHRECLQISVEQYYSALTDPPVVLCFLLPVCCVIPTGPYRI